MADKREVEKNPETGMLPAIEVSSKCASGGAVADGEKGVLKSLASKLENFGLSKRSKSASPESRKNESPVEGETTKLPRLSPAKGGLLNKVHRYFNATGGKDADKEEKLNLCEEEVTEHPKSCLKQLEKDMGIATPETLSDPLAEECKTHEKSSSVSSAPSGYSSLPDDDFDIDPTSPVFSSKDEPK